MRKIGDVFKLTSLKQRSFNFENVCLLQTGRVRVLTEGLT